MEGVKGRVGDRLLPGVLGGQLGWPRRAKMRSAERSSVDVDLRLIGFEAAQSSACCCRLGDAVAAAHSFKLAFAHHLHRHTDLPVVGPLSGAARTRAVRHTSALTGTGTSLPELGRFWLHLQQLPHGRARHVGRELLCDGETTAQAFISSSSVHRAHL